MDILDRLRKDFPAFHFVTGEVFSWSPSNKTITVADVDDRAQLLHEVAHGVLGHAQYVRDIDLLTMERQAWQYAASQLAPRYGVSLHMEDDVVQDALDSYREWLHRRSCCPRCEATGIEVEKHTYRCLLCEERWRVNEARTCRLQRHRATKTPR
ncbi:MAG: hypothetical protein Q4A34_03425 [Candidatus Saccharibacteria bacterium]|nr:hypothetical protein [Candidatus Saccharibacteria bacterium]